MRDKVAIVGSVEILAEGVEAEELGLKLPHVEACAEGLVAPPAAHEATAHGVVLVVAGERAAEDGEPLHRPPLERSVQLYGDGVVGLTGLLVEEAVRATVEHGAVVVLGVPVFYEWREEEGVCLVLQVHGEHCLIAVERAERGVAYGCVAVVDADARAGEVADFRHVGGTACMEFEGDEVSGAVADYGYGYGVEEVVVCRAVEGEVLRTEPRVKAPLPPPLCP